MTPSDVVTPERLYFDNAATSWPKPEAVYLASDRYQRQLGAAAGRGQSTAAQQTDGLLQQCRHSAAKLLGGVSSEQVLFGFNGTDVLNQAIFGLLRPGDHVVTSVVEHNSVLRPLRHLQDHRQLEVTYVDCDATGWIEPSDVQAALRPQTRLVVLVHASNVTGRVQALTDVGELTRQHGAAFVVDGCQTAGHLAIDLRQSPVDLFATSGHKGLLGPLGTGLLYVADAWLSELTPLRLGGTGLNSDEELPPRDAPQRFEAGNSNVPGIAGLGAGIDFLLERSLPTIAEHERSLRTQLVEGLRAIPGVKLVGSPADVADSHEWVGVVSFTVAGFDPREAALILDDAFDIQLRAGLHCAPRLHRRLGTAAAGGTLRASPGWASTPEDVSRLLEAVRELTAA